MAAKCQGLVKLSFQLFLLGLQLGDVVVLPEAKKAPSGLERRDLLVRNDDMPPPKQKHKTGSLTGNVKVRHGGTKLLVCCGAKERRHTRTQLGAIIGLVLDKGPIEMVLQAIF